MATPRASIPDFAIANSYYIGATVTFVQPNPDGSASGTLVTLYADVTGPDTLPNPQTLDSDGKFQQPVYIDQDVIAKIQQGAASGQTGIINYGGANRGTYAAGGTRYYVNDTIIAPAGQGVDGNVYTSQSLWVSTNWATDVADITKLKLLIDMASLSIAPDASTSVKGKIQLATVTEAKQGTNALKAIMPSLLSLLWKRGSALTAAASITRPVDANLGAVYDIGGNTQINTIFAGDIDGEEIETRFTGTPKLGVSGNLVPPYGTVYQVVAGDIIRWRWSAALTKWQAFSWTSQTNIQHVVNGRLTLTTATPITTADVLAATTLFFTPFRGNEVRLYNGLSWIPIVFSELSISLAGLAANSNFDVFLDWNGGSPQLALSAAWSSDIVRTNALALQDGVLVLSGTPTKLFLGTIRITGTIGQCEDSMLKRFVWNMYNRVTRKLRVRDGTDTWSYSTAAFRQANGNAANQVDFVRGLDEDLVDLSVIVTTVNSTATIRVSYVGIGLDSTTVSSATTNAYQQFNSSAGVYQHARYTDLPGLGKHSLIWLEYGAGADVQTWVGDNGTPLLVNTGMAGSLMA